MAKSTISIFLWPCSSSQNQPIHVTDPPLAKILQETDAFLNMMVTMVTMVMMMMMMMMMVMMMMNDYTLR